MGTLVPPGRLSQDSYFCISRNSAIAGNEREKCCHAEDGSPSTMVMRTVAEATPESANGGGR